MSDHTRIPVPAKSEKSRTKMLTKANRAIEGENVENKSSTELISDCSKETVMSVGSVTAREQTITPSTFDDANVKFKKSATFVKTGPVDVKLDKTKAKAVKTTTTTTPVQPVQTNVMLLKPPAADQASTITVNAPKQLPKLRPANRPTVVKPLPASKTTAAIRAAATSKIDTGPGRSKSKMSRNLSMRDGLDKRTTSVTSLRSIMTSGPNLARYRSTSPGCLSPKPPISQLGPRSNARSISSLALSKASDEKSRNASRRRVIENNQLKVFEACNRKMREVQSDFMKKSEKMKAVSLENVQGTYKFVAMVLNDHCKLLVNDDDLLRLPKKLPVTSVNDLKERVKLAVETGLNILYEHLSNIQMSKDEYECRVNIAATRQKLEDHQDRKMLELIKQIDVICKTSDAGGDTEMTRILKDLQETRRNLQVAERKLLDIKKQHAEELAALDRNHKALLEVEVNKRESTIKELSKKAKSIEKDLEEQTVLLIEKEAMNSTIKGECSTYTTDIEDLNAIIKTLRNRLEDSEMNLINERASIKHYVSQIESLKMELNHARDLIGILQAESLPAEQSASKDVLITELRKQVNCLEKSKEMLEEQIDNMMYQCENIDVLNKKLEYSESKIAELQVKLECQTLLPRANLDDKNEQEALKENLIKAQEKIARLEEQIERDRQMMQVRADMINALQTHELESRNKLEDFAYQLGEKNSMIDQINTELDTKTEEFRNLFNTLGAKQMELTRQCHIIKLLEENNERNQTLRVKQEERISQLDDEIAHLKHTMNVYRRIMIGNGGRNLFEPYPPNEMPAAVQHEPTCKLYKPPNQNCAPEKPDKS